MSASPRKRFLQRRISAVRQGLFIPRGHADIGTPREEPMRVFMLSCALLVACGPVASGTGSTGGPIDAGTDTDAGIAGGRPIQQFGLSIAVNGQGAVQSSPAGISCGQVCAASFDEGTSVSLTAAPASGFRFDGWGGACSGPGGCTVTMKSETQVWATFVAIPPTQHALTVILTGSGSGTVSSQPNGIDCGGTCSATFDNGTEVTLTATAAAGSEFGGWGGACTGTAGCKVTMDREQVVAVRFQPVAPPPQKLAHAITEIPGVEGNSSLMPTGIDSRGDLVGTYVITNGRIVDTHAFFYDVGTGATRPIGGNDGSTSQMANGVNDSLAVALTTDARPASHERGFLWRDGNQTDIGAIPSGTNSPRTAATAINQRGWIAGWSQGPTSFQRAVLWDGSTLLDLGSANDGWSSASAINIDGVVAGASSVASDPGNTHAAVFQNGTVKDLGTLGKAWSTASGINDRGRVVGSARNPAANEIHAFVYDLPNGPMRDVTPSGNCGLFAVNNSGDAVGYCTPDQKVNHGVLWHDGVFIDLNDTISDPSWVILAARAINDRGQIAVTANHNGGAFQAVLLTPR
jgi:probable HAF family extracellular repeat protein